MKNIFKLIIVLFVFLMFTGCILVLDEDDVTDIQIRNITNESFTILRIREVGDKGWLTSRSGQFNPGTHHISLFNPIKNNLRYDIQMETQDGRLATKPNIMVSQNGIIIFDNNDFSDYNNTHITSLHILNHTGIDFTTILIGISGSGSWILASDLKIYKDSTVTLNYINPPLDINRIYDIKLLSNTISATKTGLSLKNNGLIRFEPTDLN